jgi:hypothetical protein
LIGAQDDIFQTPQRSFESDLTFGLCRRSAEAEVSSIAKRKMTVVKTINVEAVRIRNAFRIAFRSSHYRNHSPALANLFAANSGPSASALTASVPLHQPAFQLAHSNCV